MADVGLFCRIRNGGKKEGDDWKFYLPYCRFGPIFRAFMRKSVARSKTKKSFAKRFKLTASGKALRSKAGRRHLLSSKSADRKRKLARSVTVDKTDMGRVKAALPFG